MWLAAGRGARLGVVWLVGPAFLGSGWVFRPGGSGGCPLGCTPWGPVSWFQVLLGSLPLGVRQVLCGGVPRPPRVRLVPPGPVPRPSCRPPFWLPWPCPFLLRCLCRCVCGGPCCGRGRCLAIRVLWWAARCSRRLPLVGVAPSPRVGVPSCPCAGSGGRWTQPGAGRAASGPCCRGAYWRACASRGHAVPTGVWAVQVRLLWCALPACAPWCPSSRPLPYCHGPWRFLFLACWWFLAPILPCPRCPVPVGACLLP